MKKRDRKNRTQSFILIAIIFLVTVPLMAEDETPKPEAKPAAGLQAFEIKTADAKTQLDLTAARKQRLLQASQYFKSQNKTNRFENSLFITSQITLVALNAADYFSTVKALKYEGLAEGNPIMKPFVKNQWAFAAIKIGLTAGNYFIMKNVFKKNKTLAWIITTASNFAMSYIVARNFKMINSLR